MGLFKSEDEKRKEEAHNKGQRDAANNRYDPPGGILGSDLLKSKEMDRQDREAKEAYNKGQESAKSQK